MVYRVCPGPPAQRRDFDYLCPLQVSPGVAYWLGIGSPVRSTEFDSPHSLHAGVAQVEEHRTRNAEVGFRIHPLAPADVAQRESSWMVSNRCVFDSLYWLQNHTPCKHSWRCAGPVIRKKPVRIWHGAPINYVARESHFGENVLITRKGAVRAREGDMGFIPGSMGARSYIVCGKGNPESFCSCSHGAGRASRLTRPSADSP